MSSKGSQTARPEWRVPGRGKADDAVTPTPHRHRKPRRSQSPRHTPTYAARFSHGKPLARMLGLATDDGGHDFEVEARLAAGTPRLLCCDVYLIVLLS